MAFEIRHFNASDWQIASGAEGWANTPCHAEQPPLAAETDEAYVVADSASIQVFFENGEVWALFMPWPTQAAARVFLAGMGYRVDNKQALMHLGFEKIVG